MPVSGPSWVSQFPTSQSLDDLSEPFRDCAKRFVEALREADATVTIAATLRPPERAYLMHWAYAIAREEQDPAAVPPMEGVDIQWLHVDAEGNADPAASRAAAEQMVVGYGIRFKPVLRSRHSEGRAVDMSISWESDLEMADGSGSRIVITSIPRTGAANAELHAAGKSYGVIKLVSDPPHWSADGH
jgi:hypothetical protein